jgi:hypothetical protein
VIDYFSIKATELSLPSKFGAIFIIGIPPVPVADTIPVKLGDDKGALASNEVCKLFTIAIDKLLFVI